MSVDYNYNCHIIKKKIAYNLEKDCTPLELALWRYFGIGRWWSNCSPDDDGWKTNIHIWINSASQAEIDAFAALRKAAWEQVMAEANKLSSLSTTN